MSQKKIALCLPGGGVTGAMYQIGALAALEDAFEGCNAAGFGLYIGAASGASVSAALAGGADVQRLYRSFLDPVDTYFPLQRSHLLRMDLDEWRRTLLTAWRALRYGTSTLLSRRTPPKPHDLWLQLDRFVDSLPAGLFTLDAYERLLAEFFLRRGIPNHFRLMPAALRIIACELDSGTRVAFGGPGFDHVPVSLACAASMALPLFYSPIRIGQQHYLDGGASAFADLDLAFQEGAEMLLVINPMVPVQTAGTTVPTGHGQKASLRDKGALWVYNQTVRLGAAAQLEEKLAQLGARRHQVLVLSPNPDNAALFLHNPASFANRRSILESAYKTTLERVGSWITEYPDLERITGWTRTA